MLQWPREQTHWRSVEQLTGSEVVVLGHDDPTFCVGDLGDLGIGRAVQLWQVECVLRVVAGVIQVSGKSGRELRVDQELHAAPRGM